MIIVEEPNIKPTAFHIQVTIPTWDESKEGLSEQCPRRTIAIPSNYDLYSLCCIVLESIDFDNDHLFGIYDDYKRYHKSKVAYLHPEMNIDDDFFGSSYGKTRTKEFNMEDFTLADIFTRKGKKWLMLFDYGDNWHFWLALVDKKPIQEKTKYPILIESKYDAPEQYPDYEEEDD